MPADRRELKQRVEAATPADTSRGLNYTTLFALVTDHLGPDAGRQVDVLGKGRRADFFSYPVSEYLEIAWNAMDRLEPHFGSTEAVLAELGRRTAVSFLDSMIGRTLLTVSGRDPRRLIASTGSGYRSAVSYGERHHEFLGERRARLTFRRDFMPATFHHGVILAAMQATLARRPRVEVEVRSLLDVDYLVEWD
jgi:uncharacterized protein (TIGR02265 family)